MHAGLIAVPLTVPSLGAHDERVSAVFADTTPTVILTTAAVAPSIAEYTAELTERTFGGTIVDPAPGTAQGPWLRTGDLGFMSDAELFIVGRIKDLLIVYGRNHYAEDIEATVQEITGGRVAAISVPVDQTQKLVTIIELKKRGDCEEEVAQRFGVVKNNVTSAISKSHGRAVADLVLVSPGSIPITTSGKVRRGACVEQYRQAQFARLDV